MWKKILFKVFKTIAVFAMKKLYNYIDKDKNGELSVNEIHDFVEVIRKYAKQIKRKA